jgi:hypothetical protein
MGKQSWLLLLPLCAYLALKSKPATRHHSWSHTGFLLRPAQEIVANKEADHSARWLAVVFLKNSIGKYWRARPDQK